MPIYCNCFDCAKGVRRYPPGPDCAAGQTVFAAALRDGEVGAFEQTVLCGRPETFDVLSLPVMPASVKNVHTFHDKDVHVECTEDIMAVYTRDGVYIPRSSWAGIVEAARRAGWME